MLALAFLTLIQPEQLADADTLLWDLSPWGIVGVFVLLIATGRLIPRRTYDDIIHDRNEWRASDRIRDAQIQEKDEQIRQLLEVGRTVNSIMRSLQVQAAPKDPGEGD